MESKRIHKLAFIALVAMLCGAAVWAQQPDPFSPQSASDWRQLKLDRAYTLPNQIFLLEHQQKVLRLKVRETEAKARELRDQLQKTEQELEQARKLVNRSHDKTGVSTRLEIEKP